MITTTRYEARTVYGVRICGFTLRNEAEMWFGFTRDAERFPGCTVVEITETTRASGASTTERTICAPATLRRA